MSSTQNIIYPLAKFKFSRKSQGEFPVELLLQERAGSVCMHMHIELITYEVYIDIGFSFEYINSSTDDTQ